MNPHLLALLPTQYDDIKTITDRRNALLMGRPVNGAVYDVWDADVVAVINALNTAIKNRQNQPKFAYKTKQAPRKTGKTAKDKKKDTYKDKDTKKKEKSERDRQIRQEMQGMKGKK